ncbi:uncharacterized protein LOC110601194 isoform X4 [Manihot esculenta]|nr:uncharacterized protein LOC110601194 isoform X4 [Manihot esculenta]
MLAAQRAIRWLHTSTDVPRLTRFTLQAPKSVEVEYSNGCKFNLSSEFLRIHSPAVDGKVRSIGGDFWAASCGYHVCRTCRKLWG